MYQNGSGTKDETRSYWSTTKPRVGNWQGPVAVERQGLQHCAELDMTHRS